MVGSIELSAIHSINSITKREQSIKMEIQNSTIDDIDEIFRLYKLATDLQKAKAVVP